jgi:predicted nucleic acid-binding protein
MRHVYLDTNVLLAFYGLSSEDLEQLRKLVALVQRHEITLHLPQHTKDEFARNHPNKVAEALRKLRDQRTTLQIPQLAREYPEFTELKRLQRQLDTVHSQLVAQVTDDIKQSRLKADTVIEALFALATTEPTSPELIGLARTRHDLRHPPGKADSLGDALNWEALLRCVPDREDLVFVTDDGDYASPVQPDSFHPFLVSEWLRRKKSKIAFYKRLSDFLVAEHPAITLASEARRDQLIAALAASHNFADTHSAINRLRSHVDFSPAQRNAILRAALTNTQVSRIILDEDVRAFVESIVRGYEPTLDQELVNGYRTLVDRETAAREVRNAQARAEVQKKAVEWFPSDDDDDLPF